MLQCIKSRLLPTSKWSKIGVDAKRPLGLIRPFSFTHGQFCRYCSIGRQKVLRNLDSGRDTGTNPNLPFCLLSHLLFHSKLLGTVDGKIR